MTVTVGRVGVFSGHLTLMPAARARDVVAELQDLGYGTVWIPESAGKEVLTHAAVLLPAADRIVVATGIANVWARDPMAMANAARTLGEAYPGRFLLGMGIGHRPSVELRGHEFGSPLSTMRSYLERMDAAPFRWPEGVASPEVRRVLGALGPGMLDLARTHADGAHPYLVPVEHTREARQILGQGKLLAPELAVVLTDDAEDARRIGREHFANYLLLDNYRRSLLRQGWREDDIDGGGSDALVDALVAWGDPDRIMGRVQEHLDAGADHVAIQALGPRFGFSAWSYASLSDPSLRQGEQDFPIETFRSLAPLLTRPAPRSRHRRPAPTGPTPL